MVTLKQLTREDFSALQALLKQANLPTNDLNNTRHIFIGAFENDILIGSAGLEINGHYGLIRSVVSTRKKLGTGKLLVQKIEKLASENEIKDLFLLTESAANFFEKLGYTISDRQKVPNELLVNPQFTQLCPSSAICMSKTLIN